MQEFILAAIIKMNYLFLDIVFANLCCSKYFFSQFCVFSHSSSYAFPNRPRQTAVRTGKAAAELLVLYGVSD